MFRYIENLEIFVFFENFFQFIRFIQLKEYIDLDGLYY